MSLFYRDMIIRDACLLVSWFRTTLLRKRGETSIGEKERRVLFGLRRWDLRRLQEVREIVQAVNRLYMPLSEDIEDVPGPLRGKVSLRRRVKRP